MGASFGFSAEELNRIGPAVMRERARRKYKHLRDFVFDIVWPVIEGDTPCSSNWHITMICEHLEALFRGDIQNLLMNIPPGSMKSIISSVAFPAWMWTQKPITRVLSASYAEDLSIRDAIRSKQVIDCDRYRELWGHSVKIGRGVNQKRKYETTAGGWRLATSVAGRGTGEHPDIKLVDDPHNVKQAESDAERQEGLDWYDRTLSPRGAARGARTLVVMQRIHEKDLSGHIMAKEEFRTEWEHICLPMRYEPGRMRTTSLGATDPRTEKGQLLWPELFTPKKVNSLERALGNYGTAGQMQQRPSPEGGGIIQVDKFKLWPAEAEIPAIDFIVQSYDTAYTENTQNDPTACTAWGIFNRHDGVNCMLLLDAWDDHLAYPDLRKKVIEDWDIRYTSNNAGRRGRRPDRMLVEGKSSGISLIQDLALANIPAVKYDPGRSDKIMKAHLATPVLDAGIVYVLESKKEPGQPISWARPFLRQAEKFPNDEHDDYVDTWSQATINLKDSGLITLDAYEDDEIEDPPPVDRSNPYDQ